MRRLSPPPSFPPFPGPALARRPAAQPPLRCAVDGTFAPHAFPSLQGGVQGFQIDLFREVARRMGREIVIDSASFSGLIPAMNAGRYDFLCAPTTVTRERAEALLFTEGYLWTELQFGIRRGTPPIRSEEDLRGQTISVNKGTPYERWVTANAERLNLTLLAFDTQPDAVQAVIQGRALCEPLGQYGGPLLGVAHAAIRRGLTCCRARGCTGARRSGAIPARCATRCEDVLDLHEARRHRRTAVGAVVRQCPRPRPGRAHRVPRLRPARHAGLGLDAAEPAMRLMAGTRP